MSVAREQTAPGMKTLSMPLGTIRRRALTALAFAFAVTFAVALLQGSKPFYFDSELYWSLGGTFIKNGHFSLLNFESPLRGYLFPLINHLLHVTAKGLGASDSIAARLFNSIVVASIGSVLAPRLAEDMWPRIAWGVPRRLALTALLLVFWSGFLSYPLSDLPALALLLIACIALARTTSPGWMVVAGLAVGAAIDMRPAYLPLLPIVLVLFALAWFARWRKDRSGVYRELGCLCLLLGAFALVSLPQSLSSHRHYGTWSFVPGAAAHLSDLQLRDGLLLQRYETYVGTGHPPEMYYWDNAGRKLLLQEPAKKISSTGQYLRLVANHPLTMAGVMARHVINGLDFRYSTPYVEHLYSSSQRWLRLANFLLIFLAILRIAWPAARRALGPARWRYAVALALCCATAVPSAVETRYMLPAYLLSYMLVLTGRWPNPLEAAGEGLRRYRTAAVIALSLVVFMVVVIHVVSGATSHLEL